MALTTSRAFSSTLRSTDLYFSPLASSARYVALHWTQAGLVYTVIMTTPHFCLAAPRFSWCDRARVLPNHEEDHESQTQGRPLDVVFGYDPTPISSVTPVWLRRSTPCVFVVHIRPQPVNDTRVVRSPARTLGSAVDGSFFPPFPAEVFHRFPQKRNFPVGVSQPFLHPLSGSSRGIDRLVFEAMVTS